LQEIAAKSEAHSRIFFIPYVDNISDYYLNAKLIISMSTAEGFPNVIFEAFASGLPALVSKEMVVFRELVSPKLYDLLSVPHTSQSLGNKLLQFLENRPLQEKLHKCVLKETSRFDVINELDSWHRVLTQ
jgi:glycosyltransferase involved in cell wall biosynthesis